MIGNNHNIFMSMLALNMRTQSIRMSFFAGTIYTVRDKLLLRSFPMTLYAFCKRIRLLIFSFRKHRSLPDGDNTGEL